MFPKDIFEKVNFEKKKHQQTASKAWKGLSSMQRVKADS